MQKVVVIQKSLPQYRIEFFNFLKQELKYRDIELQLIYGDSHIDNRKDVVVCDWATFKKNINISVGSFQAIWQPCLREIGSADLIIVEQADKLLLNYVLVCKKVVSNRKFAFWSHGSNLQTSKKSLLNMLGHVLIKIPDRWFAYTSGVKKILTNNGVRENRITVVQNAIDTKTLREVYNSITQEEIDGLKQEYEIQDDEKVLIYCGALSKDKNIDFLLQTADQLYMNKYRFRLFIIGSGPYHEFVSNEVKSRPWLIYLGPKFGRDKAKYFKLADIFLLPGAVGLAILDAFAFETPLVTIDIPNHGPEIEYLINGSNGIMCEPNLLDYVSKVSYLLDHSEILAQMKLACKPMIDKYNIQQMVNNFVTGIEKALFEK
jgi:L-malate glycosyltransferase